MIIELLTIFFLSAIPACFSYLLDYCLGKPSSNEPNTKAILFSYSLFWANRRAKKTAVLGDLLKAFWDMLNDAKESTRQDARQQYQLSVLLTARKYFTFEQALGLCMFCTNFWLSIIAAGIMNYYLNFVFFHPALLFFFIPVFSHTILRKF